MVELSGVGKRPRAPTITVDTSAVNEEPTDGEPWHLPFFQYNNTNTLPDTQQINSPASGDPNPNSLAVPGARPRGDSIDSHSTQSTTGSQTFVGSQSPSSDVGSILDIGNEDDVWKPESEEERTAFKVDNNPFGVTPGHLSKLIPRKNYAAFYLMKGLAGLERGLRTSIKSGLSIDEEHLPGSVSFDDVRNAESRLDAKTRHRAQRHRRFYV